MPATFRLRIETTDRYGRSVGELFDPDSGASINLQWVREGQAAVSRRYCSDRRFFEAEAAAQAAGRGARDLGDGGGASAAVGVSAGVGVARIYIRFFGVPNKLYSIMSFSRCRYVVPLYCHHGRTASHPAAPVQIPACGTTV